MEQIEKLKGAAGGEYQQIRRITIPFGNGARGFAGEVDDALQTALNKGQSDLSQIVFGRWLRGDTGRLKDGILQEVKTWTDVDWIDLSDGTAYFRKSYAGDLKKVGERRLKEIMRYTKENIKDVDISTIVFKVPGAEDAIPTDLVDFLRGAAPDGVTVTFGDIF